MRLGAFVLVFALAAPAAMAADADDSFNGIQQACRDLLDPNSNKDLYKQGKCAGLVEGVVWGAPSVCPPNRWTVNQATRIVLNYADRAPHRWHEPHHRLIQESLEGVWRCR